MFHLKRTTHLWCVFIRLIQINCLSVLSLNKMLGPEMLILFPLLINRKGSGLKTSISDFTKTFEESVVDHYYDLDEDLEEGRVMFAERVGGWLSSPLVSPARLHLLTCCYRHVLLREEHIHEKALIKFQYNLKLKFTMTTVFQGLNYF